jgi:phenylalanine-4-hydroxylase
MLKAFTPIEHQTWGELFCRLESARKNQIVSEFSDGIAALAIDSTGVPDLNKVNQILQKKTGFNGIAVTGHEDPRSFFPLLAEKKFPIGNFIRDAQDINYTPAPDVFHDLYGHLPFFIDPDYANFCQEFGRRAACYIDRPELLRQWERLFWFGLEFALLEDKSSPAKKRIWGAGIASSLGECAYALSDQPDLRPFAIESVRNQEFRIDIMQPILFVFQNRGQLYRCLNDFEKGMDQ